MKKVVYSMLVASLALFSCGGEEKKDEKKGEKKEEGKEEVVAEKVMYSIDAAASTLEWHGYEGSDPTTHFHNGTISITEGSVVMEGDKITGGEATINMASIAETTEGSEEDKRERLVGHLGNEDFFQVEAFPAATILITGVDGNNVNGTLTVLGKSVEVSIPAEINVDGESVSIASEFTVDFASLGIPGMTGEEGADPEEVVNSKVNFVLRLVANK
jgi:polyisoprenoid-binding protein YceI